MNIAVITGASSGLGAEYARTIIQSGEKLDEIWLIARRKERLDKFAEEYRQVAIRPVVLDLSSNHSYDELDELLKQENASIKILINNAGFEKPGKFISMDKTDILSMIDLNIKGFSMINRVCIPYVNYHPPLKGSGLAKGSVTQKVETVCTSPIWS